jgi:hypothetical protein
MKVETDYEPWTRLAAAILIQGFEDVNNPVIEKVNSEHEIAEYKRKVRIYNEGLMFLRSQAAKNLAESLNIDYGSIRKKVKEYKIIVVHSAEFEAV